MKFSKEQIKMLAEVDRLMDSGELPYVVTETGGRLAVKPEVMQELGLEVGQRVSMHVFGAILEANLRNAQAAARRHNEAN